MPEFLHALAAARASGTSEIMAQRSTGTFLPAPPYRWRVNEFRPGPLGADRAAQDGYADSRASPDALDPPQRQGRVGVLAVQLSHVGRGVGVGGEHVAQRLALAVALGGLRVRVAV